MKLNYPKEWFEQNIDREGAEDIGGGIAPATGAITEPPASNVRYVDTRMALGHFVELWRRNCGWGAEKLAEESGIDLEEVIEIERNPWCEPEPDAVHKLAKVLDVPVKRLLELAGLEESRTPHLREEAIRFAARSESIAALSESEKQALEAFVATLKD